MLSHWIIGGIWLGLLGLALLLLSAVCGILWYSFYWVIRDCVEEAWRMGYNGCFVEETSTTHSGGSVFLIWPALLLLALAIVCFWFALKRRRQRDTEEIVKGL